MTVVAPERYPVLRIERDADPAGDWIPLAVRMKLDLARCKIGLADWRKLAMPDRQILLALPAETETEVGAFRERLAELLATAGATAPTALTGVTKTKLEDWSAPGPAPASVAERLARIGRLAAWDRLDRFGRYAVCSLARKDDVDALASVVDELLASGRRSP